MTRAAKNEQASIDRLLANLQSVVTDAEALLKATSQQAGEKVQEARAKAEESLTAAREHLSEVQEGTLQQARELFTEGDEYVRKNPWQAVGIAAGAGVLIGLLLSLSRR
jgi:ElaB/YqjD/DUF883 family membrane-anchored ribosome-binding protein